ncbi:MAG: hypothetical protein ACE366_02480 [Bradymonadia bacterium]
MARTDPDLSPRTMAPFFTITALFHLFAVASRFPELAAMLPEGFDVAILVAHLPLILVEGYFEGRLNYGSSMAQMPLWMRLDSRPVKFTFTFAFVYLTVVTFQTWDINLGPVDFSPPDEWPLAQRAGWFAMFTVGMAFPNFLAATTVLIPGLRLVTQPLRALPAAVSVLLLVVLGGAIAWFGLERIPFPEISNLIASWKAWIEAEPTRAIIATFAAVGAPILLGVLASLFRKKTSNA